MAPVRVVDPVQGDRLLFPVKVSPDLVAGALREVPPGRLPVLVWDGLGDVGDVSAALVVSVRESEPAVLDNLPQDAHVFYACTQDDLGLPFVRHMHNRGIRYHGLWSARPIGYIGTNSVAREALESEFAYQKREGFAKWDHGPHDFVGLVQALEITRHLPGCYLEIGCFEGSSGGAVLRYLLASGLERECHFADVFEGFNYPEALASADSVWAGTHATSGREVVAERLQSYRGPEGGPALSVSVHQMNVITDALPDSVIRRGIAVANIDVDLHEAVLAALHRVSDHVIPGGIIVVEDAGHTPLLIGARLALQIFLEERGPESFVPVSMDSGQTFLIRR